MRRTNFAVHFLRNAWWRAVDALTGPGGFLNLVAPQARIAWRNILRQKRRTAAALAAVAFGVIALVVASSFIEWILWATRETTIHSHLGHVQVTKKGFQTDGVADPFAYILPPDLQARGILEATPQVKVMAPRLNFSGLASHGDSTVSFIGEGVQPEREQAIHSAHKLARSVNIVAGEDLDPSAPDGVILGEGLATNLGVKPGDQLVLLAKPRSGSINAVEVKVRGLFATISKAYDDSALRVPLGTAKTLLRVTGDHRLVLLLDQTERTPRTIAQLRQQFGEKELEFTPWYELADFYNKTATLFAAQTAVVKLIIAIIIVLSISNTLMMSVMERTGEIGTSMALGITRSRVLAQFLSEGLLLGVLGGGIGVVLGIAATLALSAIGIPMPPPPGQSWGYTAELRLTPGIVWDAFLLAVVTTLLASLYPAWKASRLIIVDALRFNR
jgi:putative ABC transport system permease protein